VPLNVPALSYSVNGVREATRSHYSLLFSHSAATCSCNAGNFITQALPWEKSGRGRGGKPVVVDTLPLLRRLLAPDNWRTLQPFNPQRCGLLLQRGWVVQPCLPGTSRSRMYALNFHFRLFSQHCFGLVEPS